MSVGHHSQAAVPSVRVPWKDASGVAFNGRIITGTGTINTEAKAPKGARLVGAFFNLSAEDSASSTVDIDIQFSPDKGTTWVDMPTAVNSETKASLAQFTAIGSKYKFFEANFDGEFSRIRANVVVAGSTATDTITYGPAYWFFSDVD